MNNHETRRQEIMRDLAVRFKSSAEIMQLIARRIGEAAESHEINHRRLERAETALRKCVDPQSVTLPFSYREFIEFKDAGEFERFRNVDPIRDADIASIDWEKLSNDLMNEE